MARSLPLSVGDATSTQPPEATANARLAGVVSVYDPAMCCSSGVCGPAADPALLTIARDLRWLEKQGVAVERSGLAQQPAAFAASPRVAGLLQAFGDGALPVVLVNGDVLCYGRYPSREEIVTALTTSGDSVSSSCCTPGSGCC